MADAQATEYRKQVQELKSEVGHRAWCSIEGLAFLQCPGLKTVVVLQIRKLEQKLAELHATDVKALNRAHQSLCQHVDALDLESTVQ